MELVTVLPTAIGMLLWGAAFIVALFGLFCVLFDPRAGSAILTLAALLFLAGFVVMV